VALTAYALHEHREQIAEAGADGLISKPITSVAALGRSLSVHLNRGIERRRVTEGREATGADAVIDRNVYDGLAAAMGADMMAELLDKVVADLASARGDLAGALEPLDPAPIRAASHILISVGGAIGATNLQTSASGLNAAARAGQTEEIGARTRNCIRETDTAIAFARAQRARL
jgi:hypothetical protein